MSIHKINVYENDTYVSVTKLTEDMRCNEKLQELLDFFSKQFGSEPDFIVKVPGRVNIIGEHVDYCGYPVLPMAIEQCILLAVNRCKDHSFLHLKNIDRQFENYKCDLNSFKIDLPESGAPEWYKYFLCGVKGIFEHIGSDFPKVGMSVAVSGNVPPSSGLSSSSALVSSATLATAFVTNVKLDRKILASISAHCERYIGTEGGGMDQAIAYLAKKGCAQFIEFHPELKATSVALPTNACFVVANSLAEKNKAATSDFNERVVECRTACRILAKRLNLNNWQEIVRFATLQSRINCNLEEMEQLTQEVIIQDLYTKEDIIEELEICEDNFLNNFLTANTRHMTTFKLRQRALHVLQESIRVSRFKAACENSSGIEVLSNLMKQSHSSLRHLYECSHPSLDNLMEISDKIGIGARLTGAGWGGCIVAICSSIDESNRYIEELKDKYYKHFSPERYSNLDNVVFATCPQNGAEIYLNHL